MCGEIHGEMQNLPSPHPTPDSLHPRLRPSSFHTLPHLSCSRSFHRYPSMPRLLLPRTSPNPSSPTSPLTTAYLTSKEWLAFHPWARLPHSLPSLSPSMQQPHCSPCHRLPAACPCPVVAALSTFGPPIPPAGKAREVQEGEVGAVHLQRSTGKMW